MNRVTALLSKGMLILGALMILAGLGWGIWMRASAPPPPEISDEGAVVLAETSPPRATATPTQTAPATTATPLPTEPSSDSPTPEDESPPAVGPAPELLPDWTITQAPPKPTSTTPPPTPRPPTPTPLPPATEPPTRIVAPAIELDARVVPMGWEMVDRDGAMISEWSVPKNAAGWHMNSALPGHGENIVLSGHHNIEGKVFRYIVDLNLGDPVILYVGQVAYSYVVTDKYILKEAGMPLHVRRRNAQWILPTGDERLTLVTCWPYEWPGNSHRVIIVARPPDFVDPALRDVGSE